MSLSFKIRLNIDLTFLLCDDSISFPRVKTVNCGKRLFFLPLQSWRSRYCIARVSSIPPAPPPTTTILAAAEVLVMRSTIWFHRSENVLMGFTGVMAEIGNLEFFCCVSSADEIFVGEIPMSMLKRCKNNSSCSKTCRSKSIACVPNAKTFTRRPENNSKASWIKTKSPVAGYSDCSNRNGFRLKFSKCLGAA